MQIKVIKFVVPKKKNFGIYWFAPWFVAITLLSGLFFLLVQQSVRLGANEPLVEIAGELSERLSEKKGIPQEFPSKKIDMTRSLTTFFYVFDSSRNLIGTTASLNNGEATIPQGVLQIAKDKEENRVTWQPQRGVRNALVVKHFKGQSEGYVAVGKSLREVEQLEYTLQTLTAIGWITALFFTFITGIIVRNLSK